MLCSLVLSACKFNAAQSTATQAPSIASNTATPTPITLTIWHGMTGAEADTLTTIATQFQNANPGVRVALMAVPINQLESQFIREASNGGGPDLLFGPKDWLGTLANAALISPLEGIGNQIGLDRLIPNAVNANQYKGRVFAFPESSNLMALWYNSDEIKTPPTNSDELLAAAQQYGLALNDSFYQAAGFFFAEGAQVFDGDQKCILDQGSGALDALNWLLKAAGTQGVHLDSNAANLDALFKNGTVGMIFNGDWAASDYKAALGAAKLAVSPPITMLPNGQPFAPFLETRDIFLSANSKGDARNAAIKFLDFFSLPETQALYAKIGHIPTNPNVQLNDPIIRGFIQQSRTAAYLPNEAEMGAVWTPIEGVITQVLTSNADPTVALAAAVQAINAANFR